MKKTILGVTLILISAIAPVCCTVNCEMFDIQCNGYLKQAADANTAELALERLNLALDYIERNNLTEGYTSILWRTEKDNIGFWYENVKACKSELISCLAGTQLEKTNVLMKVRESLTDNDKDGTTLTVPAGISRYPYNTRWAVLLCISGVLFVIGIDVLHIRLD